MRNLILLLIAGFFCTTLNAQTSVRDQDGLFFTIQVGSFLTMPSMNAFSSLGQPVNHDVSAEGMNRISLGRFKSFGEAEQFLTKVKSGGRYSDAFVTSYLNGAKITIADARNMNQVSDPAAAERAEAYAREEQAKKAEALKKEQEASEAERRQLEADAAAKAKAEEESLAREKAEKEAAEAEALAKANAEKEAAAAATAAAVAPVLEEGVQKASSEEATLLAEAEGTESNESEEAAAQAEEERLKMEAEAKAQAEKEQLEAAAKAKADSLYEAEARAEVALEAERLAAIEKVKQDSIEAAKQAIPEGLAVVHHDTKMDSTGTHELTEVGGEMVEEVEASPEPAAPKEIPTEAEVKQSAVDSMLALAFEGQKQSTTGGMSAEEMVPMNQIFNIQGKKILFSDTISDRLTGPEFVFNLKEGDQVILSANEVKGKSFKGYRILRYNNQMDKFDDELPAGEADMKSSTISEEMVNINRDGIYKVKILQPTNSFRIMSVLIEKRSKEEKNLVLPFSTNREASFVYEKNEEGKTAINTSAKSYYQRKENAGSEYSPSDIFIHETEIDDFEKHQKRGDQYQVSCCPSSKEYNNKHGIDRPITNIFKYFKGDTVLVEFSQLMDSKGNPTKFKSIDLKRYGSKETIYTTKDVGGKRFAFIAGKTGYYELSFDTYRPDEHTVSGIMTRLASSNADASFVNEVDPELIPVYFYEYNSFTKNEDLKFAIAPKPHVEANISTK